MGTQVVAEANITVDIEKRLDRLTDHELLVEMVRRLGQISELPGPKREGPLTIVPTAGSAIYSIGSAVQQNWQARNAFRVESILVTADQAVTFQIRVGRTDWGPFSVAAGVSYIVLPIYVQGGSEVEIVEATAAALITMYLVGTYVQ